ncbi:MAG TPA: UDP-glucose 4-epimerase GalE [Tepidisphaeraceae bacterium]|jgi:UDP-glucose-4-epimerase GalE
MKVLVAGGAGYIGSHTVKRLLDAGHTPVIYDNGERGHKEVASILKVPAVWGELDDAATFKKALTDNQIDTVMYFAAYAYVGESVDKPLMYYRNNVATTIKVLETMLDAGVKKFVFSSTCATYGNPDVVPITEEESKKPVSPYGRSKWMVEQILQDLAAADKSFKFAALRYFNASGCALDGLIGEDHDPETHLIPVVLQSVLGLKDKITVFGTDYPTPDGTNVRDYIHVEDLADAHILAMQKLDQHQTIQCNLGTGTGFSVKQIIAAAEKITGRKVPVEYGPRRGGDAIALWANPQKAKDLLGWEPKHKDPEAIIASAWKWFQAHPNGYAK